MVTIEEFHQDFLQSVISDADSRGLMKPESFFECVCEQLVDTGDLSNNYAPAEYIKQGIEVHGYDYDEERNILSLITYEFFQDEVIQTLTMQHISTKFKRLKQFFVKSSQRHHDDMEETTDAYSMAYRIYNLGLEGKIDKIRLIVLTDGKATRNLKEIAPEKSKGIHIEFRVIDIEYLYQIYLSGNENSEFDVESDLPYLDISVDSDEYASYLAVVSGVFLAEIYEQFGQKLFEQNVRTFLQFRGGINKGLRNTIQNRPEMFFAYNNGITATALEVETNKSGRITKMKNFQIVNGGQTTSAIYACFKNHKYDISKIHVQMKLSVVKNKDILSDFVSKVSEYANTQNKVRKSDFFSNSPFHKEFKDYSKRIWVAVAEGSQKRTRWFYERVRGEYLNEQAYLTKAKQKQFQLQYPKKQLLDKNFLSKSEVSWMRKPHIVSKGASYSFSEFAREVTEKLEKDDLAITEMYYKDAISRVILFKTLEKIISNSSWYDGGFRAQTVTYTIAYLSYLTKIRRNFFNFKLIWDKQRLPENLVEIIEVISEKVYDTITKPPAGHANIGQWCKKLECWDDIRGRNIYPHRLPQELLVDKEDAQYNKKEAKIDKRLTKGIEIQTFVLEADNKIWPKLLDYYQRDDSRVGGIRLSVLQSMASGRIPLPSEKQSAVLYELYLTAQTEGGI